MLKNKLCLAVAALALLALGSCGTANVGTSAPQLTNPGSSDHASSAFQVEVLDGTFDSGSSAKSVYATLDQSPQMDRGHVVVNLNVDGAQSLKNFYVRVKYDPTQYRAMVVQPTDLMGGSSNLLSLYVPDGKGNLDYGQTMIYSDYQVGFTGSGVVARVSFAKQPELVIRHVSVAANQPLSSVQDLAFDGTNLTWSQALDGDCDQNGEVNVADLTPLGKHYKVSSGGGPFPYNTLLSCIDVDNNGETNIADLTPMGKSFKQRISGGYHIYHSLDQADYPSGATAANGGGAAEIGSAVALSTAVGDPTTDRLHFSVAVPAPVANDWYWVRPDDGSGALGIASVIVGGNPANLPALSLTSPPSGAGTAASPYMLTAGNSYTFQLLDKPGGSDVSTPAAPAVSTFFATPSSADLSFAANVLTVGAAYTGTFHVSATYDDDGPGPDGALQNHPSSDVYCQVGNPNPGNAPTIDKDPTDANWTNVTGTGADDANAYILHTSTFNPDSNSDGAYDLTFKLGAWSTSAKTGNPDLTNSDLDWSAFPPFVPFDAAALTADGTAGTFQAWDFSDGYIFAQDPTNPGTPGKSNSLYVAVQSLTP